MQSNHDGWVDKHREVDQKRDKQRKQLQDGHPESGAEEGVTMTRDSNMSRGSKKEVGVSECCLCIFCSLTMDLDLMIWMDLVSQ